MEKFALWLLTKRVLHATTSSVGHSLNLSLNGRQDCEVLGMEQEIVPTGYAQTFLKYANGRLRGGYAQT